MVHPRRPGREHIDDTGDGYEDCDAADATINPGEQESCNGHDDDCDGVIDAD